MTRNLLIIVQLVLLATAPRSYADAKNQVDSAEDARLFTAVNLHPDPARKLMYTTNYQRSGFIPRCTEIRVVQQKRKYATIQEVVSGRTWRIEYHASVGQSIKDHLNQILTSECVPAGEMDGFTDVDLAGIREGVAKLGMSKEAIILAIGYPPPHQTHSLKSDYWMYWRSRFNRVGLRFGPDEKLQEIRN